WFLAFALTAAANVRTLALVEVLFAQAVSYYSFKQPLSARELLGIVLIVIGVAMLVAVEMTFTLPWRGRVDATERSGGVGLSARAVPGLRDCHPTPSRILLR